MKKEIKVKKEKSVFEALSTVDTSDSVSKIKSGNNELSYLSWADAWTVVMKKYPEASYEILKDEDTKMPYFSSELGIMCFTRVTIEGISRVMWLPVMNNFHIALKLTAYTCVHYGKKKNVEPATMTDINKTIMRCLTKNLAMFGAGINIYSGEDLPLSESDFLSEEEKAVSEQEKEKAKEKAKLDRFIAAAKEKVEKYFEDPSNELAKKGFEGAKNWAVENDIKEVLKQIKTYEEAFENMKDDDEAVQEKFNSVVGKEMKVVDDLIDF